MVDDDGFLDSEIGIFCSILQYSTSICQSLPSYSFLVTLISVHSISITSCEWSSPISSVVGGGKGTAKAICRLKYCGTQCFLFMCEGTYIWIPLYASICECVDNEKTSQGEVMVFEKREPQQWRNKVPIMCGISTWVWRETGEERERLKVGNLDYQRDD